MPGITELFNPNAVTTFLQTFVTKTNPGIGGTAAQEVIVLGDRDTDTQAKVTAAGLQVDTSANASTAGTQANLAGSTSSATILAANALRKGAAIFNDSAGGTLYLSVNGAASLTNYAFKVPPQSLFTGPPFDFNGAYLGIWDTIAGGATARVTEFT